MSEIHPQAKQAFQEGLESVLRQWTALELAVLNQWGGPTSGDKANQLYEELLTRFTTRSARLHRDELVDYLDDYMEINFCTICEDESTTELAELLLTMWNDSCRGDFTLITNALAREYMRSEVMAQCQGVDQAGDDIDGDDDDDDAEMAVDGEGAGSEQTVFPAEPSTSAATLATVEEADESGMMEEAEEANSGWEEVGKKKGGTRKGRR